MKTSFSLIFILLLLVSCTADEKPFDATGVFEATETTVYAEQSGVLLTFAVEEGNQLAKGQEVGLIDTTQLWLKVQQLAAARQVYQSQKPEIETQIATTRRQLLKAQQEEQRYRELVADGAAPRKFLDDATSEVEVLQKQLAAQQSSLWTTTQSLSAQMEATDAQAAPLLDQLRKCHVHAPLSGTVLEKYVERGEHVTTSKPLFKMADMSQMYLRAYVTTAQLQHLRVGQRATIYADYGNGQKKSYEGTVSWISSQSEFTPKTILTDDERADLVYAVKVAFRNDGYAKTGMYGEVKFADKQ